MAHLKKPLPTSAHSQASIWGSIIYSVAAIAVIALISFLFWSTAPILATGLTLAIAALAHYIGYRHGWTSSPLSTVDANEHLDSTEEYGIQNNPANAILSAARDLVAGHPKTPRRQELLAIIERSLAHLLDTSATARDTTATPMMATPFDLHALLNECLNESRALVAGKPLRLLLRVNPNVRCLAIGDAQRLRDALRPLLAHAIDITRQGYVSLEASRSMEPGTADWVRLEVHDTGDTPTGKQTGRDHAAATAAALVESMGGRSGIPAPAEQRGLAWIELPLPENPIARTESVAGARVLVLTPGVDPFPALSDAFSRMGVDVVHAANGEDAVAALARAIRSGNPFHGIFVDATCAVDANGAHLLDDFTDKAVLARIPLILLSDSSLPDETLRCWGYSAALTRTPGQNDLHACLHASPLHHFESDSRVRHIEPWAWGGTRPPRKRVLVVDDNRTTLMIHAAMLERADFEVETESDGARALERLLGGGYRAAVVDMRMPLMNGLELVRRYRTRRPRSRMPIVILTVNTGVAAQNDCADAGADAFLTKPVRTQQLVDTVQRLLHATRVTRLSGQWPGTGAPEESPVLDENVLTELRRLYHSPEAMSLLIDSFERDGRDLLEQLDAAARMNQHTAFCDYMSSLKGNALNLGALRLIDTCRDAEAVEFMDFRRTGADIAQQARHSFDEALAGLRQWIRHDASPSPGSNRLA